MTLTRTFLAFLNVKTLKKQCHFLLSKSVRLCKWMLGNEWCFLSHKSIPFAKAVRC